MTIWKRKSGTIFKLCTAGFGQ